MVVHDSTDLAVDVIVFDLVGSMLKVEQSKVPKVVTDHPTQSELTVFTLSSSLSSPSVVSSSSLTDGKSFRKMQKTQKNQNAVSGLPFAFTVVLGPHDTRNRSDTSYRNIILVFSLHICFFFFLPRIWCSRRRPIKKAGKPASQQASKPASKQASKQASKPLVAAHHDA